MFREEICGAYPEDMNHAVNLEKTKHRQTNKVGY